MEKKQHNELDYQRHMLELIEYIRKNSTYMPYGASIVDEEGRTLVTVIADGLKHPLLHCEMAAMLECGRLYPDCNWQELTLFSTGEACSMCTSGMCWLGLKCFVYGADIPFLMDTLADAGWKTPIRAEAMYRCDEVFDKYDTTHENYPGGVRAANKATKVVREVCKEECEQLVKDFLPKFEGYVRELYKNFL